MRIFVLVCFLIGFAFSGNAQDCELLNDSEKLGEILRSIDDQHAKGQFDNVIEQTESLASCEEIAKHLGYSLWISNYKAKRNLRKNKEAKISLEKAAEYLDLNFKAPLEYQFFLTENAALLYDREAYEEHFEDIRVIIESYPESIVFKGRHHLMRYFITDKGANRPEAIKELLTALDLFEKAQKPPYEQEVSTYYIGQTLRGLGNMLRSDGDFDSAARYYQQELELYQQRYPADHFDIGVCHFNLGSVYYEKTQWQDALDNYLPAREIWKEVFEPNAGYMRMLNEAIGDMYWELEDKPNALKYFDMAAQGEKRQNNDTSEQTLSTADSLLTEGEYTQALNYYENAYLWRQETFGKDHLLTGACKNFVARALNSKGDTEGALKAYQEAIDILVVEMMESDIYDTPTATMTVQSEQYLLESLLAKADLLLERFQEKGELKDLETAAETQKMAFEVLARLQLGNRSDQSRVFWNQKRLELTESSLATCLLLYDKTQNTEFLETAFDYSERSKALLLVSALKSDQIKSFAGVPADILEEQNRLISEINEYNGRLQAEEKRCQNARTKRLTLYGEKIQSLKAEYDLLQANIKQDYPDYYHLLSVDQTTSVGDLRTQLLNDYSALISYFLGDLNLYVFYVDKQRIELRKQPLSVQFMQNLADFVRLINSKSSFENDPTGSFNQFQELGYALYQGLLQPELNFNQNISRVFLIPDGTMTYLPFDLLLSGKSSLNKIDYKNLPYLLRNYSMVYAASATTAVLHQQQLEAGKNYLGFAPDYSETELAQLQYNSAEVEFGSQLFSGDYLNGSSSTEDIMKGELGTPGILHLAMHAQVDNESPLLSKLFFSPSQNEDGILHTYEIYNLDLNSQLVILSACNTADGSLLRGEGVMSLERAFQYAGGQALLATQWSVDDEASLEISKRFLNLLKLGEPKDKALQLAKLDFLNTARPEQLAPYYWSALRLSGNPNPLVTPDYSWFYYLVLGLAAVPFGILLWRISLKIKRKETTQAA